MKIYYETKALERTIDAAPRITPSTKSVLKKIIRTAPAADVVPEIHGSWRSSGVPGSMLCVCSRCGFDTGAYSFRYCPHCGARMDAPSNLADLETSERRRRIKALHVKGVTGG